MPLKNLIKETLNKLPYVKRLHEENLNFKQNSIYPAGHFYSPIVSVEKIKERQDVIWRNTAIDGIQGIELHTQDQIDLVKKGLSEYYSELPFAATKQESVRYYFENDYYSYTDGIVLYSMIRHFKPKRIIEVGSGYTSAIMLDTNELFFNNEINLTFIEPYPERLYSLLREKDKKSSEIVVSDVQQISLERFEKLNAGDILFIDSTHVVKTGSDVNYILFEILPRLNKGVLIHFHDVFYPFEYPKGCVFRGFNWNEDYFLKAFLMYNNRFKIKLFSEYLHTHHKEAFEKLPMTYKHHGGNLWIESI